MNRSRLAILLLLFVSFAMANSEGATNHTPTNVLFVMFDDLRGDYADIGVKTPNLDQLASECVTFRQAFATVPSCGASRCSIMTGLRPTRNRFLHYLSRVDTDCPNAVTLPDLFKSAGYTTVSNGKVYHDPTDDRDGWTQDDRFRPTGKSWWPGQRPGEPEHFRHWQNPTPKHSKNGRGPVYERGIGVSDSFYGEGVLVDKSIKDIERLAKQNNPFFLAVGFHRPHIPFVSPDRYWDMYSDTEIRQLNQQIERNRPRTQGVNEKFYHQWRELRAYGGVPQDIDEIRQNEELERTLTHAYFACVSYSDAQLGRLLKALRDPNGDGNQCDSVWDKTVIVVVSDHGFHLGENDLWAKACLWEIALHSVLMIKPTPGQQAALGESCHSPVSLVDLYPTMCDLLGADHPPEIVGTSLWPQVASPKVESNRAILSRFKAADSIRTANFRYTESKTKDGSAVARSLFDIKNDPHETTNLVKTRPELAAELSDRLSQGWKHTSYRNNNLNRTIRLQEHN